ncbi:NACHT nucleoside triphosphatase [Penicillium frequentans]|uniref:NACHT nucleoside triphosphatase n=1 Tax=Penicillium frequentans TaxID=3151616 RepID=A0AAD6D747_9EURO|nr:NACHT nucleoside triphosphatase [Penicillium glabrum]
MAPWSTPSWHTKYRMTVKNLGYKLGISMVTLIQDLTSPLLLHDLERPEASLNQACMCDLRTTDPRDDKNRIEQRWIIDSQSSKQWRFGQDSRLFWIRGDPGKGKTMLLCGIIDELTQSEAANVSFYE